MTISEGLPTRFYWGVKKVRTALKLLFLSMYVTAVHSQQHTHGHGKVFVIQEAELWQMQYILPASDVLGFEHAPINAKQIAKVGEFEQLLTDYNSVMTVNPTCTQESFSHNLSKFKVKNQSHNVHQEHPKNQHSHQDIELIYVLECAKPIELIWFKILNKMSSLDRLDVQWSIDRSQGAQTILTESPRLQIN